MVSSAVDYDGDGDVEEGIYYEIEGLQEALYGGDAGLQQRGSRRGPRLRLGQLSLLL